MATGVVAAAILVWGVIEIARARVESGPGAAGTEAAEDTAGTAAPPGTPLYREVFSVTDAVLHRGSWFILDRRGTQVHRLDESGLVRSFGGRGEGPGEFRRPEAIAARGDSVIVLDGGVLHLFDLDGSHVADRTVELGGCATGNARDLLAQPTGLLLLASCRDAGQMAWMVVLEATDGSYRALAVRGSKPGVVDVGMAHAVLGAHARGFVFGLAASDCLDVYSPEGTGLGEVCHDWIERLPLPRQGEDEMAGLRARARQMEVRLVESDLLPPFVQVFPVGGGLAYQVPVPEDLETFRLVKRGVSREASAYPLPVAEGLFAADNSVLLWWEEVDGMRIGIRNLGVS